MDVSEFHVGSVDQLWALMAVNPNRALVERFATTWDPCTDLTTMRDAFRKPATCAETLTHVALVLHRLRNESLPLELEIYQRWLKLCTFIWDAALDQSSSSWDMPNLLASVRCFVCWIKRAFAVHRPGVATNPWPC
jgi:hypothetical protein